MTQAQIRKMAQADNPRDFFKQGDIAKKLNMERHSCAEFLKAARVPFYTIGKSKLYCYEEVLEAVNKMKWKQPLTA